MTIYQFKQLVMIVVLSLHFGAEAWANRIGNGSGDLLAAIPVVDGNRQLTEVERLMLAFEKGSAPTLEFIRSSCWSGLFYRVYSNHYHVQATWGIFAVLNYGPILPERVRSYFADGNPAIIDDADRVIRFCNSIESHLKQNLHSGTRWATDASGYLLPLVSSVSSFDGRFSLSYEFREYNGVLIGYHKKVNANNEITYEELHYLYNAFPFDQNHNTMDSVKKRRPKKSTSKAK